MITFSRQFFFLLNFVFPRWPGLEKMIDGLRENDVTENQFRVRLKSGKKSVELLENKLQTSIKRFCSLISENKILREEIDHLLKERSNINTICENLLAKLQDGKRTMLAIIEEATSAYDTREEWCAKLQTLKMRAKTDELLHTQDLREMQRVMNHDGKLKEFLSVKGQKRIMKDLEMRELAKKEEMIRDEEKQVDIYESTLKRIQDFCQEENIDRIAAKYLKQEEENFALFSYVNELHHELENLNNELESLKIKLDEQKANEENNEKDRRSTVKTINEKLEIAQTEATEAEKNATEIGGKLQGLMDKIHEIFLILDCDEVPILELIGKDATINSNNVMVYLNLIEKRLTELITLIFVTNSSEIHVEENEDFDFSINLEDM